MQISDILTAKRVFVDINANSKRELLQELAAKAYRSYGIDERIFFDALLERESLGSTGFGRGIAFPHARIPNVKKVKSFFVRLNKPIDFEAIDNQPVDLIFMLISPEDSGADHLTALATVSAAMKPIDRCKKIRKAKTREDIYEILTK